MRTVGAARMRAASSIANGRQLRVIGTHTCVFFDEDVPTDGAEKAWNVWRHGWLTSREARAWDLVTNRHECSSSDDWCETFGCCGHGWAAEDDEEAFGYLRAAHLMAGLPVPDWIANRANYPPRRRSPELTSEQLGAEVAQLQALLGPVAY